MALYCLSHIVGVRLHLSEQFELFAVVEEHTLYYFRKDSLRRACDAGIIKQVASGILGESEDVVGQPSHEWCLLETALRLQEFHAAVNAASLVLPSASSCEHLFENECASAYLVFVPC